MSEIVDSVCTGATLYGKQPYHSVVYLGDGLYRCDIEGCGKLIRMVDANE